MTTQVLFIRHGETDWNRLKRIQGHVDIPLSAHGVQQAEQLGARLAREARLDAVYSSDLQRARQTAQPFADALGLEMRLSEGLRERFFGAFQAHDSDEINEKFPAEYVEWQTRDPGFSPPGDGESQRVFYHRVVHAMEPIVAAHEGGRIAVVAHGGVLDCIYRFAMKLPLQEPRNWPLLNCSINIVDYGVDGATVVSWGDVAHLSTDTDDDNLRKRA
ncbi:histidine phosphatase family protein [Caballeronia sp. LZ065]|uniref:histidine phosphatase family protein n=1 Tax=Caballeronia sp. LZ065 TaxID=3038571 RepID=UPI002864627C|nr:histidine phosphatase family protein [Caballeronia sp. LZ065]MDR5778428.1 histidine phosphatase family protein [Caballeronia sp. LZ065]